MKQSALPYSPLRVEVISREAEEVARSMCVAILVFNFDCTV
jgi:hypothetical protein